MKGRPSIVTKVDKPMQNKFVLDPLEHTFKLLSDQEKKKCSNSYNIPKEEILPVRALKRTNILLPFKLFMKKQDSIRFKKSTAISIYDKHKIHPKGIRYLITDLPTSEIQAITDLDNFFFKNLNGHPKIIDDPVFKSLKRMLNDFIRISQEIGYKEDHILNIDINKRNENRIYELSTTRLTDQANYFDSYISEDYHHSMSLLGQWERLEHKVEVKVKELQNLANEMFNIRSRIISLDYKYSQQQKYGRFLYYLSPPIWRLHNREFARSVEIEAKGFDYGESHDEDTFSVIFEKVRNICYGKPIRPVLYFNRPDEIMDVFDMMEEQQLNYFAHVTHLTPYIKNLRQSSQALKNIITLESASIVNSIEIFKNHLNFYEGRCAHLKKKFYKILFGMFYEAVGALDVLRLRLNLEFCFEKILLDKPTNMDIFTIAKHLENFYMDYSYKLDNIRSETVRQSVLRHQETEKQTFIRAKKATKELRLFHRLEKQLLRAHGLEYSNISTPEKVKVRYRWPRNKGNSASTSFDIKKRESLTADEEEYLALFTDWTADENPAKYLQRLST